MTRNLTNGELARFLDELLSVDKVQDKYTKNGLSVSANPRRPVRKIGFAVDANIETFEKARIADCDFLIVHHGLFFGNTQSITNENYNRIRYLIDHNISLYSVHIPLDVHPKYGNNITLSKMIGAKPVGFYGYGLYSSYPSHSSSHSSQKGLMTISDIKKRYDSILSGDSLLIGNSGSEKEKVKDVLICSGGGASVLKDFLANPYMTYGQLDSGKFDRKYSKLKDILLPRPGLFITGEHDHAISALAKEARVPVLFLGHYLSETTGVKELMPVVHKKFNVPVRFIEARTGL